MKKSYVILFCLLNYIIIEVASLFYQPSRVAVIFDSCVDGDTAWFLIDGKREKVRFLAIDTPESVHPEKEVEYYGVDASDYTCEMLKNAKEISLEYDLASDRYDKYDRLLAWVFVDDINLSELLVSKGYARVYYIYGNYRYLDILCEKQKDAVNNNIGIWNSELKETYLDNYCVTRG